MEMMPLRPHEQTFGRAAAGGGPVLPGTEWKIRGGHRARMTASCQGEVLGAQFGATCCADKDYVLPRDAVDEHGYHRERSMVNVITV